MMKFIAAAGLALALTAPVAAQTTTATGVTLTPAWTRATPPGSKVAGGFMTIENKGAAADRLIGGTAEVSNIFEVHEMAMDKGVMKMRALEKGLEIPAGGKVELKPGSFHVMFIDLKQPLKDGESFKGELVFEKAGKVPVTFKVMPIGTTSAGAHHGH
jgi:copper(I)-binding protein